MIDKILDVAATPNWVTPVLALISWARGKTTPLTIDRDEWGWAYARLYKHGIKMQYVQFSGELAMFQVNTKQARFAKHLLGVE